MSDTYVVVGTIGRYQVVKNPISQDEITIACDPESFDKRFGVRSDADGFTVEIEPSLTYADACRLAASMEIANQLALVVYATRAVAVRMGGDDDGDVLGSVRLAGEHRD